MAKPKRTPPPGFDDLSVDEQIDYLQALWDRIAGTKGAVPVPDWHREIIRKRLVDLESDDDSVPWEEAREEIARRLSDG
jgi:putative addiction module component (TIGR02574 family)